MSPAQQETVSVRQPRDFPGWQRAVALGVVGDALAVGVLREELVGPTAAEGVGDELAVVFAEREGDRLEGAAVGDAGQDQLGLKQRQEPVGRVPRPSGCGPVRGPAGRP